MSVGIAACSVTGEIVAVSDHLATIGNTSADNLVLKSEPLHRNWYCVYAGDDVGHAPFILDRAKRLLSPHNEEKTADQVANIISQALEETLQNQIHHTILSRYKFDCDSFRDQGKSKMTATRYNRVATQIEAKKLDCIFLVYGFDLHGDSRLMIVDEEHGARDLTQPGFWAIGSGAPPAISSLLFAAKEHGFNQFSDLSMCIYQTLAAKFMAESVRTVGEKTFVHIVKHNQRIDYSADDMVEIVREQWKKHGAPRIPSDIDNLINKMLSKDQKDSSS